MRISVLIVVFLLIGCSTMNDVLRAKNEGTSQPYNVSEDQAWNIAKTVFRWEGTDAIEEHRSDGYLLTSTGQDMLTAGTVMGCWIEKIDSNWCKVTVVTKRRMSMNIFTSLTEPTFHKRFSQAVNIIKSGKTLPIEKPQD